MGFLKENWKQLKESTKVVSEKLPDNHIPYLLDAYASLVYGEKDEVIIDESFDQIARGFIKMRYQNGYNAESYQNNIERFLEFLYESRPDLKDSYEPVLKLRMHYIWLKDFNKKMKLKDNS